MEYISFWLMLLCHIIDDFVFQPICLSKLKQKSWWEKEFNNNVPSKYKNDYGMALLIHAISWAIMIHLPLMFLQEPNVKVISYMIGINCSIHFVVDDLKANQGKLNLIQDQSIHFAQIFVSWLICIIF